MWAAGCCLLELLVGERLRGPLWDNDAEVEQRRENLLAAAGQRYPDLQRAVSSRIDMFACRSC